MKAIVSGLINIETNVAVREFPIQYFPIDYPFFGVESSVGGVGYNIAKALTVLGDEVDFYSFTGDDLAARTIFSELERCRIDSSHIKKELQATPASVVLHDTTGRRQIYCDLKDIQDKSYRSGEVFQPADICILCNINFNRELLKTVKETGTRIATDVHVLSDLEDEYNRDFMEMADILFLSDERLPCEAEEFILRLADRYPSRVIVMGRGSKGVTYFDRTEGKVSTMPAVQLGNIVNTVGAGDALFSSFLHYYIAGREIRDALLRAQVFAALKIQSNGAANGFVTEETIERTLSTL